MALQIETGGIRIRYTIKDYVPSREDDWFGQWCRCDYSFLSGDWLSYSKTDDEVFLCREVEKLEKVLSALLDDKLNEPVTISCVEPDYTFILYPKRDLRKDPHYTYISPGNEFSDIYLEWKIRFWNQGLTDNYLTVTLKREEIVLLRDYLSSVIGGA